jgi:hypothetical protein
MSHWVLAGQVHIYYRGFSDANASVCVFLVRNCLSLLCAAVQTIDLVLYKEKKVIWLAYWILRSPKA